MATKKSVAKKAAAVSEPAAKTAAKKVAVKKTAAKGTVDVQASGTESQPGATATSAAKTGPSHHDISVQAYLLWERGGRKHGGHEHDWQQAEQELRER